MALTPDMNNQIAVHNIDDQGNITGQTGLSRVVANYGNINDMNSFSPELQAAIQGYQNPQMGPDTTMMGFFNDGQPANLEQSIPTYNPVTGYTGNNMAGPINPATGGMYDLQNPFDQLQTPFDQYGQPSMHTPGMQQVEVPNPNYGIEPPSLGPFDPNFVPSSPFDPVTSGGQEQIYSAGTGINTAAIRYLNLDRPNPNFIPGTSPFDPVTSGGQEPVYSVGNTMPDFNTSTGDNTTDIFGAGNNPINNNPIAPMPSPITPPGGMNSGHSHGDLLSGIGKLFEQYFPQQGGGNNQFNQPGAQPTFDATGNSVSGGQTQSNQVFGNMITPDFGSY